MFPHLTHICWCEYQYTSNLIINKGTSFDINFLNNNVSQSGVPYINPLGHKGFIYKFMNTFRSMLGIILSRLIVMDITIFEKLFTYHFGRKALLQGLFAQGEPFC